MNDAPPTAGQRPRNWVPCGCLIAMLVGSLLLPLTMFLVWSARSSGQVQQQLTRIRQAGLPTEVAELDAFYEIPAGLADATPAYLRAQQVFSGAQFEADCRALPLVGDNNLEIPPPGEPWPERQAVETFLRDYDEGLAALHEAAAMGGAARFPLDFQQGFSMLLPQVQAARTCSRMLALEAHVKAHQGDAAGAAQSIQDLTNVVRSVENQPVLVSQLVRMALQGIAGNVLAQVLPHVEFSDEHLVQIQESLRRDDFKAGVGYAVAGERVIGRAAFKNPAGLLSHPSETPGMQLVRGSNEDLALYLKVQNDIYDAVQLDYPEVFPAVDKVAAEMQAEFAAPLGRLRYPLSAMLLPAMESCVTAAARTDGTNRCLEVAVAVERFRRREGHVPESLEALVPHDMAAIPRDPFDGQPVRYVVQEDAYLVYICGRNRVDDGGLADEQQTDEVVRIALPNDKP